MAGSFDMAVVQRGARLRRSPFFEATRRHGCWGYTVYNHMFLPIGYDDLEEEYRHLLEGVTLWDVSVERQVEITGPDAFRLASLLTPRDLRKCRVGQGKYVLIIDERGGIINDPVLLRLGENHFWLALADSDVLLWAKGVAQGADMDVEITEPDVSPLQLQGPKSKQVVQALFGEAVLDLAYYYFLETELDDIPVVVTRTGWSGEVGYEIYLRDGSRGVELWDRIMDAGRPLGIVPTGPSDIRRIEAGILNYGIDMTLADTPYHVGLDRLVNLNTREPFIGKDALARLARDGVDRRLVGVEIAGDRLDLNMTRWPVLTSGATVGAVTSAVYSPRLERNIGYAMVPLAHAERGSRFSVATSEGEREATVVAMPFVDPEKKTPKA